MSNRKSSYGVSNLIIDIILTIFTSGFWLIWVFVREMRRNKV